MRKIEELINVFDILVKSGDITKFYEKGNKSAAPRIRKKMQEIKALAQEVRNEISELKTDLKAE